MMMRRRIPSDILIITRLLEGGDQGMSGQDLEKKTNLTRKTLVANRNSLKSSGLIDYHSKGQRVTYFSGKKLTRDYQIYNDTFKGLLLDWLRSNMFGISSPYYKSNFGEDFVEKRLFEFCIGLTVLIMYILIQCVKPLDTRKLKLDKSLSHYVGRINQLLIDRWINFVISPKDLLIIFRQLLQHLGCKFPFDMSEHKACRYSPYSLNQSDFAEISKAFRKLFPEGYKQINSIKLFEKVTYLENKRSVEYHKKLQHQNCQMGYTEKIIQNGNKEFKCRQCGIIYKISSSKILKNRALIARLNKLRPPTINCKTHCWRLIRDGIPSAIFNCILCGKGATFQTESEERLNFIMDLVEQDPRLKNLNKDRTLCRDLEKFFHCNANKVVEIGDYLRKWKKTNGKDDMFQRAFIKRVSIVCEILSDNDYILPVEKKAKDLLKRAYVRNESILIQ